MIIEVIAVARHEDGTPHWLYTHAETFVPLDDEERNNVEMSGAILRRLDEAGTAIANQANVDLTRRLWERPEDPSPGEDAHGT